MWINLLHPSGISGSYEVGGPGKDVKFDEPFLVGSLVHKWLIMGLRALTCVLKTDVAVRVAATETVAVVPAVIKMSLLGNGTCCSVNGICT